MRKHLNPFTDGEPIQFYRFRESLRSGAALIPLSTTRLTFWAATLALSALGSLVPAAFHHRQPRIFRKLRFA